MGEPHDKRLLPLPPRRFWRLGRVGAAIDNLDNPLAEPAADFLPRSQAALVLDGVVQERGDRFILIPAMLHDHGGHGQQVRHVRLARELRRWLACNAAA